MFARGMFGEPRPPAGTLRPESPGPICLRTKGMVGIINKIWGALQEGIRKRTTNSELAGNDL